MDKPKRTKTVAAILALDIPECPFDSGEANGLWPDDPCPVCGSYGHLGSSDFCITKVFDAVRSLREEVVYAEAGPTPPETDNG